MVMVLKMGPTIFNELITAVIIAGELLLVGLVVLWNYSNYLKT